MAIAPSIRNSRALLAALHTTALARFVGKRPEGYRTVAVRAANHLAGV